MNRREFEQRAGRPVPTQTERKIAARIVVTEDKARGVKIPQWIVELAKAY